MSNITIWYLYTLQSDHQCLHFLKNHRIVIIFKRNTEFNPYLFVSFFLLLDAIWLTSKGKKETSRKYSVYFNFAHGRIHCHTLHIPSWTHQMTHVSNMWGAATPTLSLRRWFWHTHPQLYLGYSPLELIIIEPFLSLKRGAVLSGPNYSLDNYFCSLPTPLFLIDSNAIFVMIMMDA